MHEMETELGYCWDVHMALELGEEMNDKNCQHRYFSVLRTLELYDRVKGTLAGDRRELVLIMCFHIVRKLYMVTTLVPAEILDFVRRHCPDMFRVTKKALWAVERAILNEVGNSLYPVRAAAEDAEVAGGMGDPWVMDKISTGDPGVMDMWQYGPTPGPLPPAICTVSIGTFKAIARRKRDLEVMHHWDVMEVLMAAREVTQFMDRFFIVKPSSHVPEGPLRDAHHKFTDMCCKDPVMEKMLSVHCRSTLNTVSRVVSSSQILAMRDMDRVPDMETVEANRSDLMSLLSLAIEFFVAKWGKDVDNILRFVEMDETQHCINSEREWSDLEESLKEYTENAARLVKLYKINWHMAEKCSLKSRALVAKMFAASAKARLCMERSTNKSMEALREARRKTLLAAACRPSPTSSVASSEHFTAQTPREGGASSRKRPKC